MNLSRVLRGPFAMVQPSTMGFGSMMIVAGLRPVTFNGLVETYGFDEPTRRLTGQMATSCIAFSRAQLRNESKTERGNLSDSTTT